MNDNDQKFRYLVQLSYNGAKYCGWQIQPNGVTVQEVLNDCFSKVLKENVMLTGAGRTDTGVHASYFVAHFDLENEITQIPPLIWKLNSFLPKDIAIQQIRSVSTDFHSRFDAISRTYQYFIHIEKNPFLTTTSWYCHFPIDMQKMNEAASILFDFEDFTSFSKLHTDVKTNNCEIMIANWERKNQQMVFTIKANRFLRNMVRAITGSLVDVGRSKITADQFRKIIEKKDRSVAGTSAPAHGLFLTNIEYPENKFEDA